MSGRSALGGCGLTSMCCLNSSYSVLPYVTLGTEDQEAEAVLSTAAALGLDMHAITEQLQADGIKAFAFSFDRLVAAVGEKRRQILTTANGDDGNHRIPS